MSHKACLCIRIELQIVKLATDVHGVGGVAAGLFRSSKMLSVHNMHYPVGAILSVDDMPRQL
jgi:hypothetical protein